MGCMQRVCCPCHVSFSLWNGYKAKIPRFLQSRDFCHIWWKNNCLKHCWQIWVIFSFDTVYSSKSVFLLNPKIHGDLFVLQVQGGVMLKILSKQIYLLCVIQQSSCQLQRDFLLVSKSNKQACRCIHSELESSISCDVFMQFL